MTHNLNHFRIKKANTDPAIIERSYLIAREGLFTLDDLVKSDSLWILEGILSDEEETSIA